MYRPKSIKIENIGSIKNLDYSFKLGESQIIQGRNLDNLGQKNNGVGKSFFIDALAFALTGLTLSGRTVDEFIRDGEKKAYIEFILQSEATNSTLEIKRTLGRKKPQLIEIKLNGVDRHNECPDVNSRNDFIIKEIGIVKEDLFQFFLISKDRYKPYFKLSDTDKKIITSRFSKADVIDGVFDNLDSEIKIKENSLKDKETKVIQSEAKISSFESVLEDLKNKNSKEHKEALKKAYRDEIDQIEKDKSDNEFEISGNKKEIEILIQERDKFKETDYSSQIEVVEKNITSLNNKLLVAESEFNDKTKQIELKRGKLAEKATNLRKTISDSNSDLDEVNVLISQTKANLESSIECPSCEFEFILDSKKSVKELKILLDELGETKDLIKSQIEGFKKQYDIASEEINNLDSTISEQRLKINKYSNEIENKIKNEKSLIEEIDKIKVKEKRKFSQLELDITIKENKNKSLDDDIKTLSLKIENIQQKIKEVDSSTDKETEDKYQKLIEDLNEKIEDENNNIEGLKFDIQNLNEWVLKFKSFKSHLANLSLKILEDLMNSYLSKMNTDISIEIDGYKQKGKKISEKITETILRNNIPIGSYSRFSGGERSRIDVGSILANQTLINKNASPKGLDLILIDEVLESLDSAGIENIIKSMENINKTMILITQNEINTLPEQTLTFVKQNGELKIK